MADGPLTNFGNIQGRTDENGALLITARAKSGSLNAVRGLNAMGRVSTGGFIAVEAETAGSTPKASTFAHAPMAFDASGALAIADNAISGSAGPLTPLSMLRVASDENRSLLVTIQAKGLVNGPLTPLANLKCRVDALNRLVVAEG